MLIRSRARTTESKLLLKCCGGVSRSRFHAGVGNRRFAAIPETRRCFPSGRGRFEDTLTSAAHRSGGPDNAVSPEYALTAAG